MRFGLGGIKELTQKEVADRLGFQSYISMAGEAYPADCGENAEVELKAVKEYTFHSLCAVKYYCKDRRPDGPPSYCSNAANDNHPYPV